MRVLAVDAFFSAATLGKPVDRTVAAVLDTSRADPVRGAVWPAFVVRRGLLYRQDQGEAD